MEDPIGAIFDLSDRAAQMEPTLRRMYRYTATVVVVYLVIMVVLLFIALAHDLFLAILAIIALVFGFVALSLLRESDRFFRSFAQRHRAIRLFRDSDPAPKIPEGRTPIERLGRHLRQSNARIEELLRDDPGAMRLRVELEADAGRVPFDLLILKPGGSLFRWFGIGDAGFAILARVSPDTPSVQDLQAFGAQVQAVARHLEGLPTRAILVRSQSTSLPDLVYDFAVGHPVTVSRGWTRGRCTLEIISETSAGTYDFVPYVLGIP